MMQAWELAAYERLRTEIVKSAVWDLRKAIRKSNRIGAICEEQIKIEEWLLSKWGQLLSGDNGEYIIEKCHQTYKQQLYRNGKAKVPDSVQKEICADCRNGLSRKEILRKYKISEGQYYTILRRWSV